MTMMRFMTATLPPACLTLAFAAAGPAFARTVQYYDGPIFELTRIVEVGHDRKKLGDWSLEANANKGVIELNTAFSDGCRESYRLHFSFNRDVSTFKADSYVKVKVRPIVANSCGETGGTRGDAYMTVHGTQGSLLPDRLANLFGADTFNNWTWSDFDSDLDRVYAKKRQERVFRVDFPGLGTVKRSNWRPGDRVFMKIASWATVPFKGEVGVAVYYVYTARKPQG